ncbi:hypothetical protein [Streptomyces sp. NPDC051576]|uniref:hypothetical protein n=1 Tax=Streptomyces sp. NPDC051576 TaxID=3155803 RepID=UPI003421FBC2
MPDDAESQPFDQVSPRIARKCAQLPKPMPGDAPGIPAAASLGRLRAVRGWPTTTANDQ